MKTFFVVLLLISLPSVAPAHQDRRLPIESDGTLSGLPDDYGPVRVQVTRKTETPGDLSSVVLTSPRFRVTLNSCVVDRLKAVSHVGAFGSWYHPAGGLPPYVSILFHSGDYDPKSHTNAYISVTFSLLDGRILAADRAWDPLIGEFRSQGISPADQCAHWKKLAARTAVPSQVRPWHDADDRPRSKARHLPRSIDLNHQEFS